MIKTSKHDKQNYLHFQLDSGLRILVVETPNSNRFAAAVAIKAGHFNDPQDCPGLTHLLEHMLFQGTEVFPSQTHDFMHVVNNCGGRANAWTSQEYMNFYYDVNAQFAEPSLQHFSRFFVCPEFSQEKIEQEVAAIESEFKLKQRDEIRRLNEVHKETCNSEHPFSQFSVGNAETLVDNSFYTIRQRLMEHFEHYFTADNMTLVVSAPFACEESKNLIETYFEDIAVSKSLKSAPLPPLFVAENLAVQIDVRPLKNIKRAIYTFILPSEEPDYSAKSITYLSCLIGHECDGSLYCLLKDAGLANGLTAGCGLDDGESLEFNISVQLTDYGSQNLDKLSERLFAYINTIREIDFAPHIYNEKKKLAEIAFLHMEPAKPIEWVSQLSLKMHQYPIEEVIHGDYQMSGVNRDWLKQALAALTPESLRLVVLTPESKFDHISHYYQTPYRISRLDREDMQKWASARLATPLKLPEPNPYIPDRVEALDSCHADNEPQKLIEENGVTVWFKQDQKFRLPHGHIYVSLDLPNSQGTARKHAMTRLFIEIMMDDVISENYPAEAAGLCYNISPHQGGLTLHFNGYSQKQAAFVSRVLSQLRLRRFTEQNFNQIKQKLLASWRNHQHIKPANALFSQLSCMLQNNQFASDILAQHLSDVEFGEYAEFVVHLFDRVNLEAMIFGDWDMAQAIQIAEDIRKSLYTRSKSAGEVARKVFALQEQEYSYHLTTSHSDVAVINYFQADEVNEYKTALYMLLNQILSPIAFHDLRKEKQLGYMVGSAYFPINLCPGLIIYIQSDNKNIWDIQDNIDDLLEKLPSYFEQLDEEKWSNIQQGLIHQLNEQDTSLRACAQRYWMSIGLKDKNFRRRDKICGWITDIGLEEMIEQAQLIFAKKEYGYKRLVLTSNQDQAINQQLDVVNSFEITRHFQNQCGLVNL
ncbi:insulinase family protein [Catenovulum sediminis]|uniref:Protease 3 n=1 Tax=Catenovulum sediminis TaxID=1740262 RepID=A0ABV1RKX1_9ALTE